MLASALSAKDLADNLFDHIVDPLMGLMLLVSILIFIWIGVQLIRNSDSTDRKDLFTKLAWSIFGIFIIISVWTIIGFVADLAGSDIEISEISKKEGMMTHFLV